MIFTDADFYAALDCARAGGFAGKPYFIVSKTTFDETARANNVSPNLPLPFGGGEVLQSGTMIPDDEIWVGNTSDVGLRFRRPFTPLPSVSVMCGMRAFVVRGGRFVETLDEPVG